MFDDILGSYSEITSLKHDTVNKKSYLFVGDRWCEIGDIIMTVEDKGRNNAKLTLMIPDANFYADAHKHEGAVDWLRWGSQVN